MRKIKDLSSDEIEEIIKYISELRDEGISYSEIVKKIKEAFNVNISKATVIRWHKGVHNPLKRIKKVRLEPSPELSYVIGVYFGDGSVSVSDGYKYRIRLKVIDKEFAEEFYRRLKLSGLSPSLYYENDRTRAARWVAEAYSKELYSFLRGSRDILFNIALRYPEEFLRGFFDSEGYVFVDPKNPRSAYISATNYDLGLLMFCKNLLEILGIYSRVWLKRERGSPVKIRGVQYSYKSNLYELRIYRRDSVRAFAVTIGFTIKRKQEKLMNFLQSY
ncbi:LAGLIDADG family homing endonuclease [Pyrococcus sp. ST04]|uniref:LAGLIDADG family homing endonuclease n=1 Tax=Pyrococcus sp. ST04 TaxID=1183377 RepID=UPI0002605A65|nr:LAGLIDADG family homing endonuclease [Pyrococcus sp. ST04]AFK22038.1 hypothetical protein containing homoing endonucleases domain [Pyrococcus sp. ST04]